MRVRPTLALAGTILVGAAALAQPPSLVLNDGGIQFPDGTVQSTAASSFPAPVPDTGQTACWDGSGNPRACVGTGEDGELQAGVAWPTPRFTDNGDGTVTDNLTGLIWLRDANCPAGSMNWQAALDWVTSFNSTAIACTDYAAMTFTDWRLPNIKEFGSLIDYSQQSPPLPAGHPFVAIPAASRYWSSTTESVPTFAWQQSMGFGGNGIDQKSESHFVWPVRGGS